MKNSKLKALVNMSKLPNLTGDMVFLDCEMIRVVKGGIHPPSQPPIGCDMACAKNI